jgi:hypothetical protein
LIACALLGALAAFALPHAGRAANPTLTATVNDDYTITLVDSHGDPVTSLPAGMYDIVVHDNSALHNFHLTGPGVDESTTVAETTTVTWTVDLAAGSYHFQCDVHFPTMYGDFTVGAPGTSSSSSTTAPVTTAPPTTTPPTAPAPTSTTITTTPKPRTRCRVPHVIGTTLPRARRAIVARHCRVGKVSRRYARRAKGRVVAQTPRAGTVRPALARVSLTVSRGRRR